MVKNSFKSTVLKIFFETFTYTFVCTWLDPFTFLSIIPDLLCPYQFGFSC